MYINKECQSDSVLSSTLQEVAENLSQPLEVSVVIH